MKKSEELTQKIMKSITASMPNIQYKETAKKVLAILEEEFGENNEGLSRNSHTRNMDVKPKTNTKTTDYQPPKGIDNLKDK